MPISDLFLKKTCDGYLVLGIHSRFADVNVHLYSTKPLFRLTATASDSVCVGYKAQLSELTAVSGYTYTCASAVRNSAIVQQPAAREQ